MSSVPSVYTWVDDTVPGGADFNTYIRDPQNWLLGVPMFLARNTVQTTIPTDSAFAVPINTVDISVGGWTHAANDSKVYAQTPGWYRFIVGGSFAQTTSGALGNRGVWLYKNGLDSVLGGVYSSAMDSATRETELGMRTAVVYLNGTTDYVQLMAYQSSGSSTDVHTNVGAGGEPYLSLVWQGRDA